MFLSDPPPTQADLHFRVLGFPIRVHPFFWVMTAVLGLRNGDPVHVLVWIIVVFGSIIVHELGHAIAIRHYGGLARIVLYGFGGMAIEDRASRKPFQQIAISFAGPAAGFLLAALVVLFLAVSGRFIGFRMGLIPVVYEPLDLAVAQATGQFSIRDVFLLNLLFVNFAWGFLNLMPIYPLDGGHIARELFVLKDPWKGIVWSLSLSTITAGAIAVVALVLWDSIFMAFFFGYMAYSSWQTLQAFSGRR